MRRLVLLLALIAPFPAQAQNIPSGYGLKLYGGTGTGVRAGGAAGIYYNLSANQLQLSLNGSSFFPMNSLVNRTTVADTDYLALSTDYQIAYTSISATRTVTLQNNGTATNVREYEIKNETSSAQTITLAASVGNVDGAATATCTSSAYGSCQVYCNGANCFTRGGSSGGGGGFYQTIKNSAGTPLTQRLNLKFSGAFNPTDSTPDTLIDLTYGTTAGTVTQGNDSRLPPAPSLNGNIIYDTGSAYATVARGAANTVLLGNGAASPSFGTVPNAALGNLSTLTADAAVGANLLVKPSTSTAHRYVALATTDTNMSIAGVSQSSAGGAASTFSAWMRGTSAEVTITSDGASSVALGDLLCVSSATAGYVTKCGATPLYPVCIATATITNVSGTTGTCTAL